MFGLLKAGKNEYVQKLKVRNDQIKFAAKGKNSVILVAKFWFHLASYYIVTIEP